MTNLRQTNNLSLSHTLCSTISLLIKLLITKRKMESELHLINIELSKVVVNSSENCQDIGSITNEALTTLDLVLKKYSNGDVVYSDLISVNAANIIINSFEHLNKIGFDHNDNLPQLTANIWKRYIRFVKLFHKFVHADNIIVLLRLTFENMERELNILLDNYVISREGDTHSLIISNKYSKEDELEIVAILKGILFFAGRLSASLVYFSNRFNTSGLVHLGTKAIMILLSFHGIIFFLHNKNLIECPDVYSKSYENLYKLLSSIQSLDSDVHIADHRIYQLLRKSIIDYLINDSINNDINDMKICYSYAQLFRYYISQSCIEFIIKQINYLITTKDEYHAIISICICLELLILILSYLSLDFCEQSDELVFHSTILTLTNFVVNILSSVQFNKKSVQIILVYYHYFHLLLLLFFF